MPRAGAIKTKSATSHAANWKTTRRVPRSYLASAAPSPFIFALGAAHSDWNRSIFFFFFKARGAESCFRHNWEDLRWQKQHSSVFTWHSENYLRIALARDRTTQAYVRRVSPTEIGVWEIRLESENSDWDAEITRLAQRFLVELKHSRHEPRFSGGGRSTGRVFFFTSSFCN